MKLSEVSLIVSNYIYVVLKQSNNSKNQRFTLQLKGRKVQQLTTTLAQFHKAALCEQYCWIINFLLSRNQQDTSLAGYLILVSLNWFSLATFCSKSSSMKLGPDFRCFTKSCKTFTLFFSTSVVTNSQSKYDAWELRYPFDVHLFLFPCYMYCTLTKKTKKKPKPNILKHSCFSSSIFVTLSVPLNHFKSHQLLLLI